MVYFRFDRKASTKKPSIFLAVDDKSDVFVANKIGFKVNDRNSCVQQGVQQGSTILAMRSDKGIRTLPTGGLSGVMLGNVMYS